MADDWFEASNTAVAPLEIRTDGVWLWPADFAYYVDKYGVAVPPEFLEHMARCDWKARTLGEKELRDLATEFLRHARGDAAG